MSAVRAAASIVPRLALTLCLLASLLASRVYPTHAQEDSAQDLILTTPLRPLFIRLHVTIDRRGFRAAWGDYLARAYDDASRGGEFEATLTDEAKAAAIAALAGAASGYVEGEAAPLRAGLTALAALHEGHLPREAALKYLQAAQPPFVLMAGAGRAARGPALFPLLDGDGDGQLSPEELLAAAERLAARDFNDDEIITEQELAADPAYAGVDLESAPTDAPPATVARGVDGLATTGPLTALAPAAADAPREQLAALLLARYDRDGDGFIRCAAAGEALLSPTALAALDANGDDALDAAELASFAARPPDVELKVSLGAVTSGRDRRPRGQEETGIRVKRKSDGSFLVDLGEASVDLRRNNRDPAQNRGGDELRLGDYDRDGNNYLEAAEIEAVPALAGLFALDDADGDGKIVPEEFRAYAARLGESTALRLVLEVFDRGQELFVLLDEDRDGRLTPREMRAAAAALEDGDVDGDGQLGGNEVPQQVRLELVRGTPALVGQGNVRAGVIVGRSLRTSTGGGPRWFQKMDRNGDGDVSPREFLGPAELFPRIDVDVDGLIDRREAEAAETFGG